MFRTTWRLTYVADKWANTEWKVATRQSNSETKFALMEIATRLEQKCDGKTALLLLIRFSVKNIGHMGKSLWMEEMAFSMLQ